jgi:hypothetical protein
VSDARDAVIGHVMEIRRLVSEVERLIDSEASYDAQLQAAELALEAARLLGEVERCARLAAEREWIARNSCIADEEEVRRG